LEDEPVSFDAKSRKELSMTAWKPFTTVVTVGLGASAILSACAEGYGTFGMGGAQYSTPYAMGAANSEQHWRQRYNRTYTYNDDAYYRECRNGPDPAGIIAGGIIGGLLGNVASGRNARPAATIAGVIIGGAVGAALTRNLDCQDRSYAYRSYYEGINAGRPNAVYEWRNPSNGHYGDFRVQDYYNDPAGFRCANYTHQVYIDNRPQAATGRACQQPDGTWAIVG
jgi:surface antigen